MCAKPCVKPFAVEDFAYAFPTLSHLDSLFSGLEEEVKSSLAITDAASSVHCARLRRALDKCHAKGTVGGQPVQPATALPSQASQAFSMAALQPDSWAEHLPPKLTPEPVETMRDTFILFCPGVLRRAPRPGHYALYPPSQHGASQP